MGRSILAALLLGAAFFFGPSSLPGKVTEARAQSFGCQVGFRQKPRVWIYTDTEGAAGRLDSVAISETLGAVLESSSSPDAMIVDKSGQVRYRGALQGERGYWMALESRRRSAEADISPERSGT